MAHLGSGVTRSFGLVILLALLWGASFPLLKISVETLGPLTVSAIRAVMGGLLLLAVLGKRAGLLWTMARTRSGLLTQSLFNCIIPWVLVAWASRTIDAGLATILTSLSPIFIFLITWAVTRHEPSTPRKFVGVVLGLAGVGVIIGLDALSGIGKQTVAQLACLGGSLSYAMAAIVGRRYDKVSPLLPAAGSILIAALFLIPAAIIFEPWPTPATRSLVAVMVAGVFSTGLAFVIYFRLLATIGSIATSSQAYLRIVVGVGLGAIFLGERLSASVIAGLVLVVGGVVAMTLPERKR